jgi:hypothetical protein
MTWRAFFALRDVLFKFEPEDGKPFWTGQAGSHSSAG